MHHGETRAVDSLAEWSAQRPSGAERTTTGSPDPGATMHRLLLSLATVVLLAAGSQAAAATRRVRRHLPQRSGEDDRRQAGRAAGCQRHRILGPSGPHARRPRLPEGQGPPALRRRPARRQERASSSPTAAIPQCVAYKHAAEDATELGYTNVKHLREGISGWRDSGAAIETPPSDAKCSDAQVSCPCACGRRPRGGDACVMHCHLPAVDRSSRAR